MKTGFYEVHRDGHGDVRDRIEAAVVDFYRRRRSLPAVVVVHPSEADAAEAALKALDLKKVRVEPSGGCLVPEVWLGWEDA